MTTIEFDGSVVRSSHTKSRCLDNAYRRKKTGEFGGRPAEARHRLCVLPPVLRATLPAVRHSHWHYVLADVLKRRLIERRLLLGHFSEVNDP